MKPLISQQDALARVREHAWKGKAAKCSLSEAHGRILSAAIRADRPLPPIDRVMMDGYAVRLQDDPDTEYQISNRCAAGEPPPTLQRDYHGIEVATGAALPLGCDTVIPYEAVLQDKAAGTFTPTEPVEAGQFIHRRGSDRSSREVLVEAGTCLGPAELAIAASCGYSQLSVRTRPRIQLIISGDELVDVDQKPRDWQVRRSNDTALFALCAPLAQATPAVHRLPDNASATHKLLEQCLRDTDILLTSGGMSLGKADYLHSALDKLCKLHFHGVEQKPGKPMAFGTHSRGCRVLALPGNPVSSLISARLYLGELLAGTLAAPRQCAIQECPRPHERFTTMIPARFEEGQLLPRLTQNSGDYAALAGTDGFFILGSRQSLTRKPKQVTFYSWS